MKLYNKNTLISIKIVGDGSELFDYSLPHPQKYERLGNLYTLIFALNGTFFSEEAHEYLNDVLARFTLSMHVKFIDCKVSTEKQSQHLELKQFSNLKSIARAKNYEKVECGHDNVFWSIKLHTEALIKQYGEGKLIAYSLLESYAFSHFVDATKDKSTLKAKCRSIWNWYEERNWTISQREGLGMSREEAGRHSAQKNAEATKKKVQKAIAGLQFMQEKVNIANVARDAQVSRNTAKKYLIELGLK